MKSDGRALSLVVLVSVRTLDLGDPIALLLFYASFLSVIHHIYRLTLQATMRKASRSLVPDWASPVPLLCLMAHHLSRFAM